MMTRRLAFLLAALAASGVHAAEPAKSLVYIGAYTHHKGGAKGITVCEFDSATGKLSNPRLAAEMRNPSFLAIHPNKQWLYAVGETADAGGRNDGTVSAFTINPDSGLLAHINYVSSRGPGPCHVSIDPSGKMAMIANYSGGSVASFPILEGGKLGEAASFFQHNGSSINVNRQKEPHAHSINPDKAGRFAFAPDLGIDKIFIYKLEADKAVLEPSDPPSATVAPGSGPRHFTFHPSGKFAYVINELKFTVTAFKYDADNGSLAEIQTISTIPAGWEGNGGTAEVVCHPNGKWLYGSNRGHDSIAVFHIDPNTGKLEFLGAQGDGIKWPRNFVLDPTGKWLLVGNEQGDSVTVYELDPETGELHNTDNRLETPKPACLRFLTR